MRKFLILSLMFISFCPIFADTIIQMESYEGVYRIPCLVNGAKMKLIFDTGASSVCLSMSMAQYLYDNDYITDKDIIGTGQSSVADGTIIDNVRINLKEITIGDKKLNNVEAVVMSGQKTPLLLGQTVLKKLGEYTVLGDKLIFKNSHSPVRKVYTANEIKSIYDDAKSLYSNNSYGPALEKFRILYEIGVLPIIGKYYFASCYYNIEDYYSALRIYLSIKDDIFKNYPKKKSELINRIALSYYDIKEYSNALPFFEEAKNMTERWSKKELVNFELILISYSQLGNYAKSIQLTKDYISGYLTYKGYKGTDCWDKKITDATLSSLYNWLSIFYLKDNNKVEGMKNLQYSAAWGDEKNQQFCKENGIIYDVKF